MWIIRQTRTGGCKSSLDGGIPQAEIAAQQDTFAKFGINTNTLFRPLRPGYASFCPEIATKAAIKENLEANPDLQARISDHYTTLKKIGGEKRDDFAKLEGNNIMPQVRRNY